VYALDTPLNGGSYDIRTAGGGLQTWLFSSSPPGRDGNGHHLVVSIATDITGRTQAETAQTAARGRVGALYRMTATLSQARTPSEVVETAVRTGSQVTGAPSGTVGLLADRGRAFELLAAAGYRDEDLERWRRFPNAGPLPAADAVACREAVVIGRRDDYIAHYSNPADWIQTSGFQGAATFPLVVGSGDDANVLGFVGFDVDRYQDFPPDDVAFLGALAKVCALALHRVLAYAELERRVEERTAQLVRVRMMESLDQLTGGVAHDFNNLLQGMAAACLCWSPMALGAGHAPCSTPPGSPRPLHPRP
jgi:hypothetical protein